MTRSLIAAGLLLAAFSTGAIAGDALLNEPVQPVVVLSGPTIERNDYTNVEVFEDGSGVQYVAGVATRTFPADTFAWDCAQMGNRSCGKEK